MLILNNKNFNNDIHKQREGSEKDVLALERIFSRMNFSIKTSLDLNENEIKHSISEFKAWVLGGQETCDMIVITIMSHGGGGDSFFSTDNRKISMDYILKYFQIIWISSPLHSIIPSFHFL